jgi:breast cancer 2 susceptibility protein
MVLCVTAVHRSTEPQTRPYLELTDGWYRINADVDECLARAVVKGKIAVGRKLSISGAKVR